MLCNDDLSDPVANAILYPSSGRMAAYIPLLPRIQPENADYEGDFRLEVHVHGKRISTMKHL